MNTNKENPYEGCSNEIVTVKLPRHQVETLEKFLKTQESISEVKRIIQGTVIWIAGGFVTIFAAIEGFKAFLGGLRH